MRDGHAEEGARQRTEPALPHALDQARKASHDQPDAEAEGQRIAGATADAMEGGMAFLQKRKAEFKGK